MMHSNVGQLMNVFNLEEIQSMLVALAKLKDNPHTGKFKVYTNGFQEKDLIYPFIKKTVLNRIETLLDRQIHLLHGMLLKETTPWDIHTDYVKGDANPDMAILIPLNSTPVNTHTVIFNESCTDTFETYIANNKKLVNNASYLHDTIMSHETLDKLEYVSLLGAFRWIPGSVIYWDRKLLHASDNFLKNNIMEKQALVLFTTFV